MCIVYISLFIVFVCVLFVCALLPPTVDRRNSVKPVARMCISWNVPTQQGDIPVNRLHIIKSRSYLTRCYPSIDFCDGSLWALGFVRTINKTFWRENLETLFQSNTTPPKTTFKITIKLCVKGSKHAFKHHQLHQDVCCCTKVCLCLILHYRCIYVSAAFRVSTLCSVYALWASNDAVLHNMASMRVCVALQSGVHSCRSNILGWSRFSLRLNREYRRGRSRIMRDWRERGICGIFSVHFHACVYLASHCREWVWLPHRLFLKRTKVGVAQTFHLNVLHPVQTILTTVLKEHVLALSQNQSFLLADRSSCMLFSY